MLLWPLHWRLLRHSLVVLRAGGRCVRHRVHVLLWHLHDCPWTAEGNVRGSAYRRHQLLGGRGRNAMHRLRRVLQQALRTVRRHRRVHLSAGQRLPRERRPVPHGLGLLWCSRFRAPGRWQRHLREGCGCPGRNLPKPDELQSARQRLPLPELRVQRVVVPKQLLLCRR